jgi:ribosomal protein L37AE/L43A
MPCVSLYTLAKTLHRRWQAYRYGRKMQRNPATGPTRAKAAQYFCPECDRDLLSYRQTRDWYTVRPAVRQSNSIKKKRFVRKMEEHIGPFYTFKAVFVLVVGIFRILGRFGWGRELGRLVRARFEVLMHASEAYRQKEANVAWSASSPV